MSTLRGSEIVALLTALVFVISGLTTDAPTLLFLVTAGWLAMFVVYQRRRDVTQRRT